MADILNGKSLFIDFDSTFVKVETIDEIARLTLETDSNKDEKIKLISDITNRAMSGEIAFPVALEKRLQVLSITSDIISAVTTEIESMISDSFKENQDTIRQLSDQIWIVSGGFKEIITPIAIDYGIDENHILANEFLFEGNSVTGCDKNNPLFQNQGKIKAIESVNTNKERVMIGDGYTDLEVYLEGGAQHFICYTENVSRKKVVTQSKHIASSFNQVLEILKII